MINTFSKTAIEIHASNVEAGWWTNIKTGESLLHTRNRPEMLMLAVSEIAEAAECVLGQADEKLTHLPAYDVELADFVIRQFDLIGGEVSCGHKMPDWGDNGEYSSFQLMRAFSRRERLMRLVMQVAIAMENYRKGRINEYMRSVAISILDAFLIAKIDGIDLWEVMNAKRAYNASRADHKVENRLKTGGKAF